MYGTLTKVYLVLKDEVMNKHFLHIVTGTLSTVILSDAKATVSGQSPMFDAPNIRMLSENDARFRKNSGDITNTVNQKADRDTVTKLKLSKFSEKTIKNDNVFCQSSQEPMKAETEFSLDLVQAGRISSIEDNVFQIVSNVNIETGMEIVRYRIEELLEENADKDLLKDLIAPLNEGNSDLKKFYESLVNLIEADNAGCSE